MKLADKILYLRKKQGMSQEALAEQLNVSRQAISRWEMGTAQPDASNLLQLSKLFSVSADFLLNDEYENDNTIQSTQEDTPPADEPVLSTGQTTSTPNRKTGKIVGLCIAATGLLGNFIIYCVSRTVKVMVPIESASVTGEILQMWSSSHTDYSYKYFIQERNLEFLTILFWILVASGLVIAFVKIKKKESASRL